MEAVIKNIPHFDITRKYKECLAQYSGIFSDIAPGSIMDFAIYDTIESFLEKEAPLEIFNVVKGNKGIEIRSGKSDNADLQIALSTIAVLKLVHTNNNNDYIKTFGHLYNDPDEDEGWVDFVLYKRVKSLIDIGYGKFAQKSGIIE